MKQITIKLRDVAGNSFPIPKEQLRGAPTQDDKRIRFVLRGSKTL